MNIRIPCVYWVSQNSGVSLGGLIGLIEKLAVANEIGVISKILNIKNCNFTKLYFSIFAGII